MFSTAPPPGTMRLVIAIVLATACLIGVVLGAGPIVAVLHWLDLLFPKPGLGGVVLLMLSPVAFLALAHTVQWVCDGFSAGASQVESDV
jgi:hypothetical protein